MTITSIELDERRSATGIRDWQVRSSLDSFVTSLGGYNVPDNTSWRCDQSVSLGASFQGLTSTVTFRIYGYNAEASTGTWRIDEIQVNGSLSILLPLQWISLEATDMMDAIRLDWISASEPDNNLFTIERSNNGHAFYEVGHVQGHGSSSQAASYTYLDEEPVHGTVYYRIAQADPSGTSYSTVVEISRAQELDMVLSPNPASDFVTLTTGGKRNSTAPLSVVVTDILGRVLSRETHIASSQPITMSVHPMENGFYHVTMEQGEEMVTRSLVVMH
jgi:hypothetical protein